MFLCLKTTKAIPQNRQVGDGFCCQCAYYYSAGCAGVSVAGVPVSYTHLTLPTILRV